MNSEQLVFNKDDNLRTDCGLTQFVLAYFFIGTAVMGLEACVLGIIHDYILTVFLALEPIVFK